MDDASEKHSWLRRATWLAALTVVYNVLEAGVALYAGIRAGSIALVGFGLDSVIELAAALVVLWRLSLEMRGASLERVRSIERRVARFVGVTLLALAAYVTGQAGLILWTRDAPGESWLGVALAGLSLIAMPLIAVGKLRAARQIGSVALGAEAKETLACAYLSFALLIGLGANALFGWWWADPVTALLMVPWLVREGLETIEGEEE